MTKGLENFTVTGTYITNTPCRNVYTLYLLPELHWSSWEMSKGACESPWRGPRCVARDCGPGEAIIAYLWNGVTLRPLLSLSPIQRVIASGDPSIPTPHRDRLSLSIASDKNIPGDSATRKWRLQPWNTYSRLSSGVGTLYQTNEFIRHDQCRI